MSNVEKSHALRNTADGKTSGPSVGGHVDYFYIGSYTGGDTDDLDKLITEMLNDLDTRKCGGDEDGCENCGKGCLTCGGCNCENRRTGGCEVCDDSFTGGSRNKTHPILTTADLPLDFTRDKNCPNIIKDESPVVLVEPALYETVETQYKKNDGDLLVETTAETPLVIDTTPSYGDSLVIKTNRNTLLEKSVPRDVLNSFNDDSLVVMSNTGQGGVESSGNTRNDNVKIEYKNVVAFVEKYANTIKNTNR